MFKMGFAAALTQPAVPTSPPPPACTRVFFRRQVAGPGDTVLDCTAGNGHDSLELAKTIALKDGLGSLYAMDVQARALSRAGPEQFRALIGGMFMFGCQSRRFAR